MEEGEALRDAEHDEGEVEEHSPEGGEDGGGNGGEVGRDQLRGQAVYLYNLSNIKHQHIESHHIQIQMFFLLLLLSFLCQYRQPSEKL